MSALLDPFHFLHPWWLLSLIALPLAVWLGTRRSGAALELSRLVDADLLPHLLRGRSGNRRLPVWLFAIGWVLAALALAGPSWSRVKQPLYASRAAQVVALSLSQHMLARDVAPSRIDRARYKVHDLLASNHDGLNALIGYAGEAFVVAPLTSDANSLDDLLDAMAPDTMPEDGNNAAAAIQRGVALIQEGKAGEGSLVLITDQVDAAAIAQAAKAKASGVHVSVLGVGTTQGGPVPLAAGGFLHDANGKMALAARDDASLRALAAAGGGVYVPMSAGQDDIDALHAQLRRAATVAASGQVGDAWQDRGVWLLVPLLLIVALAFRRGWLMLLPLVLLPMWPRPAAATTWQDLWQRPDQRAAQALHNGHPKQAQQLARDPAWRGAAAYRAGDYVAAAEALDPLAGTDPAYNLGNALAKQGNYQQAIKAYDHALQQDPENVDAKANRKAVEDWLKQQKSKQKPSDKNDDKGQDGDKKQPKSGGGEGNKKPSDANKGEPGDKGSKPSPSDDEGKSKSDKSSQQPSEPADASKDQPPAKTPQQQAAEKAKAEQAAQALKQQMDQQLAGKPSQKKKPGHQLGTMDADDPQSKLPADLQRALQRVPDDPGALLRRKFELEYQQRHGGAPDQD